MENANHKIAMFIDSDNAPAKKIEKIITELANYGVVSIRKAYGNWKSPALKGWEENLHEYAIQPIQQFDLIKGKNATDMAMTIDAMDILYTKNIDAFCIVSSDCDFTPLVMRILSEGKIVYGFGERKAPDPFVNACSRFLYVDEEKSEKETGQKDKIDKGKLTHSKKISAKDLKSNTKLINLLRVAIDSDQDDDEWASVARVGSIISNQASIDARNYGYKKLGDLIKAIDLFETKVLKNGQMVVRDKRGSSLMGDKVESAES
tara:strand:+ start:310 stop:1095 length:786 start_codon:yes stop_codon:yes gene_type:complete